MGRGGRKKGRRGKILRQTHHLALDGRENLYLPKPDYLKRETKLFLPRLVSLAEQETCLCPLYHTLTLTSATVPSSVFGLETSQCMSFALREVPKQKFLLVNLFLQNVFSPKTLYIGYDICIFFLGSLVFIFIIPSSL